MITPARSLPAAVLALAGFVAAACGNGADEEPAQDFTLPEPSFWTVSTVEEAEEITGFPVASPQFLPPGLTRTGSIAVATRGTEQTGISMNVTQAWLSEEDPTVGLMLVQDESTTGLGRETEPVEINGREGERLFWAESPMPEISHPQLDLFWRDGGFSYHLTGILAGPLTEDVLLEVAASISAE